jgi:hypothetical protein
MPLTLLLVLLAASSDSASDEPGVVTRALYLAFVQPEHEYRGQPYFERVKGLLAPSLLRALAEQHQYEAACKRSTPADVKPHMIDQNPFLYWPDGVTDVGEVKTTIAAKQAIVEASLSYASTTWQDKVHLELHEGHWRVSDIHWGDGGSLSARLKEFMASPCGG